MSPKTTPRAPRASAAMPSWRRASRPRDEIVIWRKLGDASGQAVAARTVKVFVMAAELPPAPVAVARRVYLPGASRFPFTFPLNLTLLAPALPWTPVSVPRLTVFFLPFTVFLPSTSSFTEAAVESVKEIVVPFGALPVTVNLDGFRASFERLGLDGEIGGGGVTVVVEPPLAGGVTT